MSAQKLSCGVTQDLYDTYRALIPEGVALPTHLRGLVQAFVDNPAVAVVVERYTDPETLIQRQADLGAAFAVGRPYQMAAAMVVEAEAARGEPFVGSGNTTTVTRPALVDPASCLHPHGTLVREGRFVRCTLCDQIVR